MWAQEIRAQTELDGAWTPVQAWLRALIREDADDLVAEELLAFPGIEELMALRAVREAEASGMFDTCVVDCAPTGSTMRCFVFPTRCGSSQTQFFELERRRAGPAAGRARARRRRARARGEFFDAFERLYEEIDDVQRILLDGERTSARLVVNPTRVVVDETRRSYAYLSLYGVATDAVLVNRLLPEVAAGGYFKSWRAREEEELAEIERSFPVPIRRVSLRAREVIGIPA